MKIIRKIKDNGNQITVSLPLTADEVYNAYLEQEHIFDREDIVAQLTDNGKSEIHGMFRKDITKKMIDEMAYEKRRQMDKYGYDWVDACDKAIEYIVKRELKGE